MVDGIQLRGGTILGTSRGGAAKIPRMVDRLDLWGINMVFVVGGNGGNAAASAIHNEVEKRGLKMAVVGVPKSIDNDILLVPPPPRAPLAFPCGLAETSAISMIRTSRALTVSSKVPILIYSLLTISKCLSGSTDMTESP